MKATLVSLTALLIGLTCSLPVFSNSFHTINVSCDSMISLSADTLFYSHTGGTRTIDVTVCEDEKWFIYPGTSYTTSLVSGTPYVDPYVPYLTAGIGPGTIAITHYPNYSSNPKSYAIDVVLGTIIDHDDITAEVVLYLAAREEITVSSQIASGNDDAEEGECGTIFLRSSDLELVHDSFKRKSAPCAQGNQEVGLIFRNLGVPKGSEIVDAYIQFTAEGRNTRSTSVHIYTEAFEPADFIGEDFNISNRQKSTLHVDWAIPSWNQVGESDALQKTPQLKALIQETLDGSSKETLDKIAFIITGEGRRQAESYNGSPSGAARLFITYVSGDDLAASRKENIEMSIDSNDQSFAGELSVETWPNPTDGELNVDLYLDEDEEEINANITLFDHSGRQVMLQEAIDVRTSVDLEPLKPGLYTLMVQSGKKRYSKRIMKK